jgi:hypothetical protein
MATAVACAASDRVLWALQASAMGADAAESWLRSRGRRVGSAQPARGGAEGGGAPTADERVGTRREEPSRDELRTMSARGLRTLAHERGVSLHGCVEKPEYVERLVRALGLSAAVGEEREAATAVAVGPLAAGAAAAATVPSAAPPASEQPLEGEHGRAVSGGARLPPGALFDDE